MGLWVRVKVRHIRIVARLMYTKKIRDGGIQHLRQGRKPVQAEPLLPREEIAHVRIGDADRPGKAPLRPFPHPRLYTRPE